MPTLQVMALSPVSVGSRLPTSALWPCILLSVTGGFPLPVAVPPALVRWELGSPLKTSFPARPGGSAPRAVKGPQAKGPRGRLTNITNRFLQQLQD